MRALVVVAHPVAASFTHAVAASAVAGLVEAGHEVDALDLYATGFRAAMTAEEHVAYQASPTTLPLDDQVAEHIALVRGAQILVFCYPTWWSGLPAILKGWLERVLVEGVAFRFNRRGKVRPALTHVRWVIGISTYGSPKMYIRAINDNGRRIMTRALRISTGLRTRSKWLAMYSMDGTTDAERAEFLTRVRTTLAGIGGTRR